MQALNATYEILILAQVVLGLAVVMGLLNVLNIAHGEFVMIGFWRFPRRPSFARPSEHWSSVSSYDL